MQGHLRHLNDEADQRYGLLAEHRLASLRQAVAAGPRLEMLHGLPKVQVGTNSDPHLQLLVAVVALPCAGCLPAGLVARGALPSEGLHKRKGRSRGEEERWGQELLTSA